MAAAFPGSALVKGLIKDPGYDLAGRVRTASADPGMGYPARVELARELLPGVPAEAGERIARRTATFGEVFTVAAADTVAGLEPGTGTGAAVAAADAAIDAVLVRAVPSREAAVLAWAGGALHERQVDACLRVLGAERVAGMFMCGTPGSWPAWPTRRPRAAPSRPPRSHRVSAPAWRRRSWPLPGTSRIPWPGWRTGRGPAGRAPRPRQPGPGASRPAPADPVRADPRPGGPR
ncbi:MAG TPA: hypothetical protein VN969_05325 [Streptosporangiaceae bacterium]|nr:hypothetical protein [Streptosporangiaceae bacterium]